MSDSTRSVGVNTCEEIISNIPESRQHHSQVQPVRLPNLTSCSTIAPSILKCTHRCSMSVAPLAGPDLWYSTEVPITPYGRGGNPVSQGMPPLTLSTSMCETVCKTCATHVGCML